MLINKSALLSHKPISIMKNDKHKHFSGLSFGLTEVGYDIRIRQEVTLHPFKKFALASSVECFDMPDNLVGYVFDKSTWARQGLSLFNTVIEPGWRGYLTLELQYSGWKPLHIPMFTPIAAIHFHTIAVPTAYKGKYQDQKMGPQKAI